MSIQRSSERRRRSSNGPDQRVRLTPSLVVALWSFRDERGNERVSWSIDKHNDSDPEIPFRMCDEGDALELGFFAQRLCLALAGKAALPLPLRKKLASYANALAQAEELWRAEEGNGEAVAEDSERDHVLSFE